MAGRASSRCRSIRRFDTTNPCETFGQPWRHHPLSLRSVLVRLYCLKQPIEGLFRGVCRTIEGPFRGVCRTIEGPCYRGFVLLGFTRRWLWGIRLARLLGAPSPHRPGRLPFQSIYIGGDGGGRLRAGRVVLLEEAL